MKTTKDNIAWGLVLALIVLELSSVYIPRNRVVNLVDYFQAINICLAFAGAIVAVGAIADALLVLGIFYTYIIIVDNIDLVVPKNFAALEVLIVAVIIFWIKMRPTIRSEPISKNVCLAFYYGNNASFLARVSSLIGMPAQSIAIIIGDEAIVPNGELNILEKRSSKALVSESWLILDTFVKPSNHIIYEFNKLAGKQIICSLLKFNNCLKTMTPFLNLLGPIFNPGYNPGLYQKQIMDGRKVNGNINI